MAENLDDAIVRARKAASEKKPLSIGILGNAADVLPAMTERALSLMWSRIRPALMMTERVRSGGHPLRRSLKASQDPSSRIHRQGPPFHGGSLPRDSGDEKAGRGRV